MDPNSEVLEISSDEDSDDVVFVSERQSSKPAERPKLASEDESDDDCIILDGDPDNPVAVVNDPSCSQVLRLQTALPKENKSSTVRTDALAGKKRPRELENEDSNGAEKVKAIEKLRQMGIRQLREQATLQRISSYGLKKKLLERLSVELDKDSQSQKTTEGNNAEKLPLGKLSKATILKILTNVPLSLSILGFRATIQTFDIQEDPLYSNYQRLHCELTPLEVDSEEFSMIEKYMQNTHAKTHSNYTVDIVQLFRVSREGEEERFRKFSTTTNRMLLWHGSPLTNWIGILSTGLRIATLQTPVAGKMFGRGVYFADMFSKSAHYCRESYVTKAGVLLLCEVALGEMDELRCAKYNADQLPAGKLSTKIIGSTAPDSSMSKTLKDGVIVPLGKPKEQPGPKGFLYYNEYIVYNVEQIRMRYIVQVNFNFTSNNCAIL
ncbi:poly [ADP-ribose] polymerase 2-like [Telopea speciosissima]|uniref:poly [ADP-ribose] polymerase 2-like n=1 Tax=Telopea speciosissima TaxID=54955 RepID=UPI001CC829B6|nr:poly [ADP-ribose] polymerase 2-like [Telopea speciosissima]